MNIDSFYTYLEHPELLNQQTLAELKEINDRYPYFQTSRVLFLKNLHLLNDYRYADELKKVSAYAANRQALYNLIHDELLSKEISYQKEPVVIESIEEKEESRVEIKAENSEDFSEIKYEMSIVVEAEKEQVSEIVEERISETPSATELVVSEITEPKTEEAVVNEFKEKSEPVEVVIEKPISFEPDTKEDVQQETELKDFEIQTEEKVQEPEVISEKEIVAEEIKTQETKVVEEPVKIEIPTEEKKPEVEPVSKEPVKESIADIILRKVAEIHQSRKEPYKPYVHPVVEKKKVEEKVPEIKEQKEFIPEMAKPVEEISQEREREIEIEEKPELVMEDVIPEVIEPMEEISVIEDQKIEISEKLNFEITNEIQEIVEPIKDEPTPCIEIEHIDNVELEDEPATTVSDLVQVEEIKSEEIVVEEVIPKFEVQEFEEPVFTSPVYDISLLIKEMPEEIVEEEPKEVSDMSMSFSQWLNFMSEGPKPKKSKTELPDLIDAFLSNTPKMSFQDAETDSAEIENQATVDDDYISEALADILLGQGHTSQALNMYQKLALKYPEKKAYFADRILKIKKLNSNQ